MKTKLLLLRGLLASVLFAIGFTSFASRFDPIMDLKSTQSSNDTILRTCETPCMLPPPDGGDEPDSVTV